MKFIVHNLLSEKETEREREREANRVGIRKVWQGSSMKFLKLIELCFRQDIRYDKYMHIYTVCIYIPIYTI